MPTKYIIKTAAPGANAVGAVPPVNVSGIRAVAKPSGGSDTYDFLWNPDGTMRVFPNTISVTVPIVAASVDTHVFIADDAYQVVSINEVHSVVGGSSAALSVKKCTGTTAPASGTALHATGIDLTATVNTNIVPTLVATTATLQLAATDKLAFDFSGTLTGLVGTVTLNLRRITT